MLSIEGMATAKDSSGENPTRILFVIFHISKGLFCNVPNMGGKNSQA